jgi:hypothetical protein
MGMMSSSTEAPPAPVDALIHELSCTYSTMRVTGNKEQ